MTAQDTDSAAMAAFIERQQKPFLRLHFAALQVAATLPPTSNARQAALNVADHMLSSARAYDWSEDRDSSADTAALSALENQMLGALRNLPDFGKLPEAIRTVRGYFQGERQRQQDRQAMERIAAISRPASPDCPTEACGPRPPE